MSIDKRTEQQKEIDLLYKRRVQAGIALLEEKYGKDWVNLGEEVWRELFDIGDSDRCILGGIGAGLGKGDYGSMLSEMDIRTEEDCGGVRFGFTVGEYDTEEEGDLHWGALQRLWEKELRARGVHFEGRSYE